MQKAKTRIAILTALIGFSPFLAANPTKAEQQDIENQSVPSEPPNLVPETKHRHTANIIRSSLAQQHLKKTYINNQVSAALLDELIDMLDGNKSYFYAADIMSFEKYRYKLDDSLANGNVNEVYDIHYLFMKRWLERYDFALAQLELPFSFEKDESYFYDRSESEWFDTEKQMNAHWRKRVKNDVLNLKLAGNDIEKIKSLLKKRYNFAKRRIVQTNNQDVFNIYMNALLTTVEPHTSYLSPRSAENFDIDMSLKLQGIGAVLQSDDVYTKVVNLIPKGPADKSKEIQADDKIIAVGQGDNGDLVDIVGWRLDDVVALIRGEKGSTVRLEIIPKTAGADARSKVITIVREEIKLEEEAAKSEIIEIERNGLKLQVGVITLPKFYIDFEAYHRGDKNYRSTTRDMRKILEEYKEKDVDGVVVDLRNNGGGSLIEATQSTGLFIAEGPIVQDKNLLGEVQIHKDYDSSIVWDGPLMVVVNSLSASASEIFAAAIQDYGRGLIVGSQTFGKGTVQSVMNLNRWMPNPTANLGHLKYTVSKFYRVTGDSTQHKGVIPDITFPDIFDRNEVGESSAKNALPWDQIKPVSHKVYKDITPYLDDLGRLHKNRTNKNVDYQYFLDEIEHYRKLGERKSISLNEKQRKLERDKLSDEKLARVNQRRKDKGQKALESLEDIKEEDEIDVIKDESVELLSDFITLKSGAKYVITGNKQQTFPVEN
ncbi:MAG: carboxy terminal-processing peptidase [Pseudomonadota bacterium]